MDELQELKCVPCRGDSPKVTLEEMDLYLPQVPEWQILTVDEVPHLERVYRFKNFKQALEFTDQVGALAEQEEHHPRLQTEWGRVTVTWWTHKIKGLHRNDFIMAAKSDEIFRQFQEKI